MQKAIHWRNRKTISATDSVEHLRDVEKDDKNASKPVDAAF